MNVWEEEQPRDSEGQHWNGVENSLRNKSEGAFRTDEEVCEDVYGTLVVHKGVERITSGVFHPVF
jgi:hypothetical protein